MSRPSSLHLQFFAVPVVGETKISFTSKHEKQQTTQIKHVGTNRHNGGNDHPKWLIEPLLLGGSTFWFVSISVSISPLLLFSLTLLLPRYIRIEHHNQIQSVLYWILLILLHHILQAPLIPSSSLQVNIPVTRPLLPWPTLNPKHPWPWRTWFQWESDCYPYQRYPPSEIRMNNNGFLQGKWGLLNLSSAESRFEGG